MKVDWAQFEMIIILYEVKKIIIILFNVEFHIYYILQNQKTDEAEAIGRMSSAKKSRMSVRRFRGSSCEKVL